MNSEKYPSKNLNPSKNTKIPKFPDNEKSEDEASLVSSIVANLFLPGIGTWKLGARKRGAIIMVFMLLCTIMGGLSYVSSMNSQLDAALDMQDDAAFEASFNSSGNSYWMFFSGLIFVYSFVDIFLVYRSKKKHL